MPWWTDFQLIMRSSWTTLREKLEDPERVLHQLLIDMEDELAAVRSRVADAIVDEVAMSRRTTQARAEVQLWAGRARTALKAGDELNARAALERKVDAERRGTELAAEEARQKAATASLQLAVQDLEEKIRQARERRTLLLARLVRADTAGRVHDALERPGSNSAFAQFQRLEERVERAEAREEAHARLAGRDAASLALEREILEKERREAVEKELELLRGEGKENP